MQYIVVAKYKTVNNPVDKIMLITSDKTIAYEHDVSTYTPGWEVWVEVYDTNKLGECTGIVSALPIYPKGNLYE